MTKVNFFPNYYQHKASTAKQKTMHSSNSFLSAINLTAETTSDTESDIMDKLYAEFAVNSSAENPIVKLTIPMDNYRTKDYTIFIKSIDPENATLSELFALVFYADAMGISTNHWSKLNYYKEAAIAYGYTKEASTINEFFYHKQNWNMIIAQTTIHFMETGFDKQAIDGKELLTLFAYQKALKETDKESNWRTMSDKAWDKMLKNMDEVIDAWKERLKILKETQLKAAGEAARLAPAAYQSMAAQSAWNAVAMLGILSPTGDSSITLAANAAMLANSIEKTNLQKNDVEYF